MQMNIWPWVLYHFSHQPSEQTQDFRESSLIFLIRGSAPAPLRTAVQPRQCPTAWNSGCGRCAEEKQVLVDVWSVHTKKSTQEEAVY